MADLQRKRIRVDDLHFHPDLTPKLDELLILLMDDAVTGDVPVYFAAVPLSLCIPFDPDYRPDLHPVGAKAIEAVSAAWQQGEFRQLIVYPRGVWFVVSDNYIALFAALRGQPDYVPCWVLGKPEGDLVKDVQGPIEPSEVAKALGIGTGSS